MKTTTAPLNTGVANASASFGSGIGCFEGQHYTLCEPVAKACGLICSSGAAVPLGPAASRSSYAAAAAACRENEKHASARVG
eukprot:6178010-Pleurochrysis_carterae.AAC.2